MAYIHVYQGNPTAGGTNGTLVSEATEASAISFTLNASNNEESTAMKLAVRCEVGYQTTSAGVTVDIVDNSASGKDLKWALASDNAGSAGTFGAYGATLTLSGVIGATNVIFWVKAKATSDEAPQNDTNVDLKVEGIVEAV